MKTYFLKTLIIISFLGISCTRKKEIDKQQLLNSYKSEYELLEKKITQLEEELGQAKDKTKAYPVSVMKVRKDKFSKFTDIPGIVTSKQNIQLFSEVLGNIIRIYVREGQQVYKGQLIAKQDASAITAQLGQLKSNLRLAQTTYERQKRLWDQKIGSEIQFLQAKTNKESLEEQINALNAQIAKFSIYSPINGVVDELFVNQGEMATNRPIARIVNLKNVQIEAQLSEKYIGKVKKKDVVMVMIKDLNIEIKTKISSVGQIVDPVTRTFRVEAAFTNPGRKLKPNMSAVMKIMINKIENVVTIPFNIVQKNIDESYVFVAEKDDDKDIAIKKIIKIEDVYQGIAAVKQGIKENELLIVEGHTKLQNGLPIMLVNK